MSNPHIRSSECAWQDAEVKLLGRVVKGLRGWEYKKVKENEFLRGAGNKPIDIQEGNESCTGSIKVLGFELDALNKTAQKFGFDDITDVPHEAIVVTIKMQKTKLDPKTFVTISGIKFSEQGGAMEQGAKMREVTLPFMAMDITPITL